MPSYWPTDVSLANLKHWLEPALVEADLNQMLPNNTAVAALRDMMAVGDYAQATAANKPLYKTNQRYQRGCLDFDGSNDFMVGPDGDLLVGTGQGTIICAFAPDDHTTVQDIFADPNARLAIRIDSGNVGARNVSGGTPATSNRAIAGAVSQWHVFAWRHGGGSVHGTLDDPDNTVSQTSAATDALAGMILGAGTGAGVRPYNGRFGGLWAWNAYLTGDDFYKPFFYALSRWGDRGDPLEQARKVASEFLQRRARPRNFVEIRSNLRAIDAASAADVGVAHPRGPHPAAAGWLKTTSERRPTRKFYSKFSPSTLTVDLKLADAYDVAHTFRETGAALRSADPRREGVAVSGVGSSYEFYRIGYCWIRDPGDLRVVPVPPGIMKAERTPIHWAADPTRIVGGILTEHFATNHLTRSSFINGFTGITQTPGAGGTIALDSTAPLLWDTTVTPQAAKLTSGTTDCHIAWAATISFSAGQDLCFSVDYRCDSGNAMSYQLVRNVDGRFWDNATQAWVVGNTWNALTVSGVLEILRGRSKNIDVGAGATTVTARVGFPGTTAGRIGHVYHVQLESPGGFPTSRIPTTTAEAARALELIARPNPPDAFHAPPSTRRGWPNTEGSLLLKFTPLWNRIDLQDAGGSAVFLPQLYQVHHSVFGAASGHGWSLQYDPSTAGGQLQFFGSSAGQGAGPARATFNVAMVAGQTYRIGARWGTAGPTVSLFVDGVKGTDATYSAPTETDDSMIYVGGRNDADGYLEDILISPRALHDETMKAWRA